MSTLIEPSSPESNPIGSAKDAGVTPSRLAIGGLGAALQGRAELINLGPEHPSRAGLVQVNVSLDDAGLISRSRVQPGYSHRAAEKLFEVRDYRQILMLADRHDWTAAAIGEQLIAKASEDLLGLPVPERARLIRAVLVEHARIASHLSFLSYVPFATATRQASESGKTHALAEEISGSIRGLRDQARQLLADLTGNRVHPMATRLGGVAVDPTPTWLAEVVAWTQRGVEESQRVQLLLQEPMWRQMAHVGHLSPADCDVFGLTGPISRASGLQRCVEALRAQLPTPQPATGGVLARFQALIDEVNVAAVAMGQLADQLATTPGPIDTKLSKIVKVPEGEVFADLDAPMGIASVHLVSRGATTPWRLRLRTPTFANVQAAQKALVGARIEQAGAVIASLGYTIGDLDK